MVVVISGGSDVLSQRKMNLTREGIRGIEKGAMMRRVPML